MPGPSQAVCGGGRNVSEWDLRSVCWYFLSTSPIQQHCLHKTCYFAHGPDKPWLPAFSLSNTITTAIANSKKLYQIAEKVCQAFQRLAWFCNSLPRPGPACWMALVVARGGCPGGGGCSNSPVTSVQWLAPHSFLCWVSLHWGRGQGRCTGVPPLTGLYSTIYILQGVGFEYSMICTMLKQIFFWLHLVSGDLPSPRPPDNECQVWMFIFRSLEPKLCVRGRLSSSHKPGSAFSGLAMERKKIKRKKT